jgi:hypothetical protein
MNISLPYYIRPHDGNDHSLISQHTRLLPIRHLKMSSSITANATSSFSANAGTHLTASSIPSSSVSLSRTNVPSTLTRILGTPRGVPVEHSSSVFQKELDNSVDLLNSLTEAQWADVVISLTRLNSDPEEFVRQEKASAPKCEWTKTQLGITMGAILATLIMGAHSFIFSVRYRELREQINRPRAVELHGYLIRQTPDRGEAQGGRDRLEEPAPVYTPRG